MKDFRDFITEETDEDGVLNENMFKRLSKEPIYKFKKRVNQGMFGKITNVNDKGGKITFDVDVIDDSGRETGKTINRMSIHEFASLTDKKR